MTQTTIVTSSTTAGRCCWTDVQARALTKKGNRMAQVIANQSFGQRQLLVPDGWNGDQRSLGWIEDCYDTWQVPIGSAMARGVWTEVTPPQSVDTPTKFSPWEV